MEIVRKEIYVEVAYIVCTRKKSYQLTVHGGKN